MSGEKILLILADGHYSTKEIASKLGIKTKVAYDALVELEKLGKVYPVGYLKTKGGMAMWDDRSDSKRHTTSLHWEIISNQ